LLGSQIKNIRTAKGITQLEVAQFANITQSTYSKFEKDLIEVRGSFLIKILDALDIPLQEFNFIQNNYKLPKKEIILNNFFNAPYNNQQLLSNISKECATLLNYCDSALIQDIQILCKSLSNILAKDNFEEARKYSKVIWERLSKNNDLYLYDLYLLNAILFIFPLNEMREIHKYLMRGFKRYEDFPNIKRISVNTSLNVAVILIMEHLYEEALIEIESILPLCKEQKVFIPLAIGYIRKGICLNQLSKNGDNLINKGLTILKVLEEFDTYENMKKELVNFNI